MYAGKHEHHAQRATGDGAMPFRRRREQVLRASILTGNVVRDRRVFERDRDEILSRDLCCFLDGNGDIRAFGDADADATLVIPDHDRGAETKTATALHHARDARKVENLLIEFAFLSAPTRSLVAFSCHTI